MLVTVKHAANLKDTELLGKQEPYVRLQLGGEKVETDTERGVNPVFNEQVKLPLPSSYFARTSGMEGDGGVVQSVVIIIMIIIVIIAPSSSIRQVPPTSSSCLYTTRKPCFPTV